MKNKIGFVIYLMAVSCQIVLAERATGGYIYNHPNIPQIVDVPQIRPQELNPHGLRPSLQAQSNSLGNSYENGQLSLPNIQNTANFAFHQQAFNQPSLNFQAPPKQQLNNINYLQPQQFNSQTENVMRIQFNIMNENQGNSIEQGCNAEPIVGQFKPELVDLANGGPLTRMITTCGPNTDCKTIALQSDLNRVQGVLPKPTHNQNRPHNQRPHGYNIGLEGRGNAGSSIYADVPNLLIRPPNRRLIQYTEILEDDIYN